MEFARPTRMGSMTCVAVASSRDLLNFCAVRAKFTSQHIISFHVTHDKGNGNFECHEAWTLPIPINYNLKTFVLDLPETLKKYIKDGMIVVNMNATISTSLLGDNTFAFFMVNVRNDTNAAPETEIAMTRLLKDG